MNLRLELGPLTLDLRIGTDDHARIIKEDNTVKILNSRRF